MTPPEIHFTSRARWRGWLTKNASTSSGIWLVFDKGKNRTLSTDDIVEEALCFGWIDSKPGKVDDERSKVYLAPRNPKSNWSKINKDRVAKLLKAGLMTAQGKKVIELAKTSGTWSALDQVEKIELPKDLLNEFKKYKQAQKNFDVFPRSVKRAILEWILNAKKPETREKRIQETVRQADKNIRANQWQQ